MKIRVGSGFDVHQLVEGRDLWLGGIRLVPVVYATLPGNHRFTAIAGPNVQYDEHDITGGVALNIRGGGAHDTSFENYHLKRGQKLLRIKPRENIRPEDPYERLMSAINDGSPILISGATATGKTNKKSFK